MRRAGQTAVLVATPVFGVAPGSLVGGGAALTLSTATPGATLHYTLETQYGITADTVYVGPITLEQPWTIVRTWASAPGLADSAAVEATYTCTMLYGDLSVGQRLMNTSKSTVVMLGDSRLVHNSFEFLLCQYGSGVPWGGCNHTWNATGTGGGAWATTTYPQIGTVVTPTPLGNLGTFSPRPAYRTVFAAGAAPAANQILTNASITPSTAPVMLTQWQGHDVTFGTINRKIPAGLTTQDAYNSKPAPYVGTKFDGLDAVETNVRETVLIAAGFNWTIEPTDNHQLLYTSGAATRAGEELWITGSFCESDNGVTAYNCAVSGSNIDNFLNPDIFDGPVLWAEYFPLLTGDLLLWMDLGTNNPGGNTAAQHQAKLEQLIAQFRVVNPNGQVLLTTAYPASTEVAGTSPYYRDAAIAVAASTAGVMTADTHFAMPAYAAAVAAGIMADGTHYNLAGNVDYAERISSLIAGS